MAKKQWQTGDIVEAEDLNRLETATQPVTSDSDGLMSKNDKTKLDGIESGAQKNPDTVSTTKNGLMSANDKTKLDGIESGAQVNPNKANQAEAEAGTDDSKYMTAIRVKQSILKNTPAPSKVTTTADGLMSSTDKTKLDEISTGATKNTPASSFTSTSDSQFLSAKQLKDYMKSTDLSFEGSSALVDIPKVSSGNTLPGLVPIDSLQVSTSLSDYSPSIIRSQILDKNSSTTYDWTSNSKSTTTQRNLGLGRMLAHILGMSSSTTPLLSESFEIVGLNNIRKNTNGLKYTILYTRGGMIATVKYIDIDNLTISLSGPQLVVTSRDINNLNHSEFPLSNSEPCCFGTYLVPELSEPFSIVTTYIKGATTLEERVTYQIRKDITSPNITRYRSLVGSGSWSDWA